MYLSPLLGAKSVTLWWCYTTAPGTLGVTRHLLVLVSLGSLIQGLNRTERNSLYTICYHYLLNQMSGTRHQHKVTPTIYIIWFTMFTNTAAYSATATTSVQAKQYPITALHMYYNYIIYQLKYIKTYTSNSCTPSYQMATKIFPSRCKKD